MALLLPEQIFDLAPQVGKSYYENLTGGDPATIIVNNFSEGAVGLVLTRVNEPVTTYVIPGFNSLSLTVDNLLVAALLTGTVPAFGTIHIATAV
ncbi:hypothetical protein [Paenibacillus lactis]|uniref:hypothetical protein n=1 Tax=Paenibacillus lactis TaxID=228574 RepID=UPI0036A4E9EE